MADKSKADVAKLVKRVVVEKDKDGKLVEKKVDIKAADVLAFRDYGDYVRVVTADGQKLDSRDA